jgi:hypothetical protein
MQINFTPQRRNDTLVISKAGDTLTINGVTFDFSVIPDGATLPSSAVDCDYITGNIERIAGVLHLSLILPTGPDASQAANFPAPLINPANGVLELPQ